MIATTSPGETESEMSFNTWLPPNALRACSRRTTGRCDADCGAAAPAGCGATLAAG